MQEDYCIVALFIILQSKIMIKRKVTTDWIVRQIREGKAYRFYLTADWHKVRDAKKAKEHYECERCRTVGKYSPCEAVHHKLYLRARPDLALDINNLECLCKDCHYKEHHKYESKKLKDEFAERW